mmetsp:Transcript_7187/g.26433  ORF Transcript_7187/g.26433 Transcript_7187/m.26433 type:complete len:122 (+) Transcript_7187:1449-1814(+)|eukprot:scaffold3612_cov395-Prasinococcus_capsulatus_cf.AAC.4
MNYLNAGAPVVVANLWDVTDKDIDRFSERVLRTWLPSSGTYGKSRHSQRISSTSKSPASEEAKENTRPRELPNLVGAPVPQARAVCRLPYLNGAAPICYGVPTLVTVDASEDAPSQIVHED